MNETILYIVGGLAIAGVAFFLFRNMKKGIKKEKQLQEDRKNN
jgi:hypothetical protein